MTKKHIMWAVLNYDVVSSIEHTRKRAIENVVGQDRKWWRQLKRQGAVRCVRVEIREIRKPRP